MSTERTDTLDEATLAREEAIYERATPGPWAACPSGLDVHAHDDPAEIIAFMADGAHADCDAVFIAAAREGWPRALAEVRRLRNELTRLVAAWRDSWDCSADPGHAIMGAAVERADDALWGAK